MYLRKLYLRNFRCFEEHTLHFDPKVNPIIGPNASGKTTILEAIHFLITGKSFRARQVTDLIRREEPSFTIDAAFEKHGVDQRLQISYDGKDRRITYNNTPCPSTTSILGILQGVLITPDDANLIKGTPAVRRSFLDLQIAQVDPLYVHHLSRYLRAMQQRNHLLKSKQTASIDSWEAMMAPAAAYVVKQRVNAIEQLQSLVTPIHASISSSEEIITLKYKTDAPSSVDLIEHYSNIYLKNRSRELDIGFTLQGPHRDDLLIALNGMEARYFSSEGQQRSCVASLRLSEWQRLKQHSDAIPLMLMDDIGVSLDQHRYKNLRDQLSLFQQVFITNTTEL